MLLASGLTAQADHFRASQITSAAGASADFDCVFFLSLTKILLVNDCQMSVLQPAASPKDSHKAQIYLCLNIWSLWWFISIKYFYM